MKTLMDEIRFQQGLDSCLYAQEILTPGQSTKRKSA